MLSFISQGIGIGFLAGATPGPLQSYVITTTLLAGWRKSLIIIVSPLITDIPIILVMVVILKKLPPELIRLIQIVGGLYLLWIAYGAWKRLRQGFDLTGNPPSQTRTLGQGMIMNWLSPGAYIFWGTINGPLLVSALALSIWHGIAFLVAFYGTFLGLLALYVLIFDRLRGLDARVTRGLFLIAIIGLVLFSLSLIGQGLGILSS